MGLVGAVSLVSVLLLTPGCGATFGAQVRPPALARRFEDRPVLACNGSDVLVVPLTAEEIWSGTRRTRAFPLPVGAVTDLETGDLISLPPAPPRYFVVACIVDHLCWRPEVLVACDDSGTCTALADNAAEEGLIDCPTY